ncbi:phosphotransferase [Candidatus Woesearchaeota archaeon]|nr:phosphotransferase [Candidatus Woesearchaeota archaeon]
MGINEELEEKLPSVVEITLIKEYTVIPDQVEFFKYGLANKDFIISVNGKNEYFAKVHFGADISKPKRMAEVELEERVLITLAELQGELHELGVSVAKIVPTKDRRLHTSVLVNQEGKDVERVLSLYKFIQGYDYGRQNGIDIDEQTRSLAIAHRAALADLQHVDVPLDHKPEKIPFVSPGFDLWEPKLEDIEAYFTEGEEAVAVSQLRDGFEEARAELDPRLDEYDKLPMINIFADYHPFNAIFRGNDVVALVDPEFVQQSIITYDLIAPLARVARTGSQIVPENVGKNIGVYIHEFLEGEHWLADMARAQMEWLPIVMRERLVQNGIYDLWTLSKGMSSNAMKACNRNLALHQWVSENPDFFRRYS